MAEIEAGDEVEVRSSDGRWHRTTARSGPRLDHQNAFKTVRLSIAVDWPSRGAEGWVNWPAEDVRPAEGVAPPPAPST